jgi:uncharacterized protein (TIGR02001 family)
MSSRKNALATLLCAGLLSAGAAHAEVSGSITLTSDYLFRGVTQTDEKPALQGCVEWAHESGFYVGTWGSSISWLSDSDPDISSQLELDGYVGFRGDFGDSGFGYDVGAVHYWYPGSYPAGFNKADTTELYAGVSWNILSAKYSYAVTDLFGIPDSDGSSNLDVAVGWEFAPSWTLNGAVGKHCDVRVLVGGRGQVVRQRLRHRTELQRQRPDRSRRHHHPRRHQVVLTRRARIWRAT